MNHKHMTQPCGLHYMFVLRVAPKERPCCHLHLKGLLSLWWLSSRSISKDFSDLHSTLKVLYGYGRTVINSANITLHKTLQMNYIFWSAGQKVHSPHSALWCQIGLNFHRAKLDFSCALTWMLTLARWHVMPLLMRVQLMETTAKVAMSSSSSSGDPEVFPGRMGHIISSVYSGSTPWSAPSWSTSLGEGHPRGIVIRC